MDEKIKVIYSPRKSIALEIGRDLQVVVRAPYGVSREVVERFVEQKRPWLEKHMVIARTRFKGLKEEMKIKEAQFAKEELLILKKQAYEKIPMRAAYFADLTGVNYRRITVRFQHTRWGSCSEEGNLSFNGLLMLCPEKVLDYVVVHELCHRKQMNHSPRFWKEVGSVMLDYREQAEWLKKYGGGLLRRLP